MSQAIRTFEEGTTEYKKLQAAAAMVMAHTNLEVTIKKIYFDLGQDWWWTTLVAKDPNKTGVCSTWQLLTPKAQEIILFSDLDGFNAVIAALVEKYNK